MTLASAQQFIQRAVNDPALVQEINAAPDHEEIEQILTTHQFSFNGEHFEQAYFNVLTWCQTHEQADAVKEVKLWWDCLQQCMDRIVSE